MDSERNAHKKEKMLDSPHRKSSAREDGRVSAIRNVASSVSNNNEKKKKKKKRKKKKRKKRKKKKRRERSSSSSSRRRRPRQSENRITEMLKAEKQF
tara:strand:+ start:220 stop:510 length:291 start_codon:yes stop_codon:yes gene_type:complete